MKVHKHDRLNNRMNDMVGIVSIYIIKRKNTIMQNAKQNMLYIFNS